MKPEPREPQTTLRRRWRRLVCRWRGHRWVNAGILTDKFYHCFQIVKCRRCGVDQEDVQP